MYSPKLTLSELFSIYWADHPELSTRWRQCMRHHLRKWERWTRNPAAPQITESDLWDFRANFNGHAASTVNSHLRTVRALLRHAQQRGIIDRVPRFPFRKEHTTCKPTPSVEDLGAMYAVAPEAGLTWPRTECPYRFWRRWLVVGYLTGLRLGDMLKLSTEHMDWEREVLLYQANKTSKVHLFPLCKVLMIHLTFQCAANAVSGSCGADDAADVRLAVDATAAIASLLPCSDSPHLIRRELRKLCRAARTSVGVTPQAIRRASVTEWSIAGEVAGGLIHGRDLGVIKSYAKIERILREARPRLAVPSEFMERESKQLRLF